MNLLLSDVKRIFFYSVFYLYTLILLREKWGGNIAAGGGPRCMPGAWLTTQARHYLEIVCSLTRHTRYNATWTQELYR